jgi:hypothetical protein
MTSTHAEFDAYFDKLCDILVDGDNFDADIVSDDEFRLRLTEIMNFLKGVNRNLTQKGRKSANLAVLFVASQSVASFFDLAKYNEYLDLWDRAVVDGFLPDTVCPDGPAMANFIQGGTGGVSLPQLPNLGTPTTPDLPILGCPTSEWLAPSSQKVYDLASFLPAPPSGKAKISTPKEWVSAIHQLGHGMGADPTAHEFVWSDFVCYVDLTGLLSSTSSLQQSLNTMLLGAVGAEPTKNPGVPQTPYFATSTSSGSPWSPKLPPLPRLSPPLPYQHPRASIFRVWDVPGSPPAGMCISVVGATPPSLHRPATAPASTGLSLRG